MRLMVTLASLPLSTLANWDEWWTYDGISGHKYWGVMNRAWTMCSKGRQQSPVNISPDDLVYDPKLSEVPFQVDKQPMSGSLHNTGQLLVFKVDPDRASKMPVNITGGPLSYRYQFEEMYLHWSPDSRTSSRATLYGSEHSVNGHFFPAEIQLYGFNAHLFNNLSEAMLQPHGVVAVSIMIQESDRAQQETNGLKAITSHLKKVVFRGQSQPIHGLNLAEIMPSTNSFMTYEGSTTYPGCWETVTWVIMNKPIYASRSQMRGLQSLLQGDKANPKSPLSGNVRPVQPMNGRTVRTNINFPSPPGTSKDSQKDNGIYGVYGSSYEDTCPDVFRHMSYKANTYLDIEPLSSTVA